jgi:hypothetical protein
MRYAIFRARSRYVTAFSVDDSGVSAKRRAPVNFLLD